MANKNQHVVPHDGKWAVKGEGSGRIRSVYDTKQEAIDAARQMVLQSGGQVIVHGRTDQVFREAEAPSAISEDQIREAVRGISRRSATEKHR